MTRRKIEYWVIPPEADAEFVAHMEQVLDLYQRPYDPDCPVVCMDEQPVQLVKETRPPVAATKARPRRVDYEYERAGTASVFLFSEPLAGWRQATARARRTKADWAVEVAGLLEGRYADCPRVTLVCDNLNTHTKGAFAPAGVTPPQRYYTPLRHPLAFGSLPGVAGYRTYLAPTISRRGEEGFSSCSACPCHRAVATTPPKWVSRVNQVSTAHAAFAFRLQARPSEYTFEATSAFTSRYGR